ncbi:MAG: hypothetical protein AB7O97_02205 [Planctomycetota bacterium]
MLARPSALQSPPPRRRARAWPAAAAAALALPAACAGPALPRGFVAAAAEAPEDMPARLWLDGDAVTAAACGVGPGGLPAPVRSAVEAVTPGGETVFVGREWGPAGDGYRVDKRYADGPDEQFRSALIAPDGAVLERSHSVPLLQVPPAVLTAAAAVGRDVQRCEIVSGPEREQGWRALVVDGGGRTFALGIGLDGRLRTRHRLVSARIGMATR